MTQDEVFAILADQGVAKVVVVFSGGGDEGGVEEIILSDKDEKVIRTMEEYYPQRQYEPETRKWVMEKVTGCNALSAMLCKPVYDRYHTFAGDFFVRGTVVWDVANHTVKMNNENYQNSYDDYAGYDDEPADYD